MCLKAAESSDRPLEVRGPVWVIPDLTGARGAVRTRLGTLRGTWRVSEERRSQYEVLFEPSALRAGNQPKGLSANLLSGNLEPGT